MKKLLVLFVAAATISFSLSALDAEGKFSKSLSIMENLALTALERGSEEGCISILEDNEFAQYPEIQYLIKVLKASSDVKKINNKAVLDRFPEGERRALFATVNPSAIQKRAIEIITRAVASAIEREPSKPAIISLAQLITHRLVQGQLDWSDEAAFCFSKYVQAVRFLMVDGATAPEIKAAYERNLKQSYSAMQSSTNQALQCMGQLGTAYFEQPNTFWKHAAYKEGLRKLPELLGGNLFTYTHKVLAGMPLLHESIDALAMALCPHDYFTQKNGSKLAQDSIGNYFIWGQSAPQSPSQALLFLSHRFIERMQTLYEEGNDPVVGRMAAILLCIHDYLEKKVTDSFDKKRVQIIKATSHLFQGMCSNDQALVHEAISGLKTASTSEQRRSKNVSLAKFKADQKQVAAMRVDVTSSLILLGYEFLDDNNALDREIDLAMELVERHKLTSGSSIFMARCKGFYRQKKYQKLIMLLESVDLSRLNPVIVPMISFYKAVGYYHVGNYAEAKKCIDSAQKLKERSTLMPQKEVAVYAALILEKTGQRNEARAACADLDGNLLSQDMAAVLHAQYAWMLFLDGNYDSAITQSRKVEALPSREYKAMAGVVRMLALIQKGSKTAGFKVGVALQDEALLTEFFKLAYYQAMSALCIDKKRYEAAISYADKCLACNQKYNKVSYDIAAVNKVVAQFFLGEYKAVIKNFAAMPKRGEFTSVAHAVVGCAYFYEGKGAQAVFHLTNILKLSALTPLLHYHVRYCKAMSVYQNDEASAAQCYRLIGELEEECGQELPQPMIHSLMLRKAEILYHHYHSLNAARELVKEIYTQQQKTVIGLQARLLDASILADQEKWDSVRTQANLALSAKENLSDQMKIEALLLLCRSCKAQEKHKQLDTLVGQLQKAVKNKKRSEAVAQMLEEYETYERVYAAQTEEFDGRAASLEEQKKRTAQAVTAFAYHSRSGRAEKESVTGRAGSLWHKCVSARQALDYMQRLTGVGLTPQLDATVDALVEKMFNTFEQNSNGRITVFTGTKEESFSKSELAARFKTLDPIEFHELCQSYNIAV